MWCWRRLLRVPWTARRSNQSILKETVLGVHWKDWCWGWNSNTLATSREELTHWKSLPASECFPMSQYFGHLTRRIDSLENTLMLGGIWGKEKKGTTEGEMAGCHHWLDGHEFAWTPGVDDGQGGLACCNSWGHKESDTTEWLKWNELKINVLLC